MNVKTLTAQILDKMSEIGKWQRDFLIENFDLQCRVRGRHNFLNMTRYSSMNESTFHVNYQKGFDFKQFNLHLCNMFCEDERTVAFDPSHISKSGKHTPGCGYFWSGCAGKAKWGLDIGGFATIDIKNNTAMHFFAQQTLDNKEYPSLLEYYTALVCLNAMDIKKISKYLVVDAYFSKNPFMDRVCGVGLEIITRLRDDANLVYPYVGPHPKRKGRPTEFGAKFDPTNLDPAYFTCCIEEADFRIYETTLYSVSMKRYLRIAVMHRYDKNGDFKSHSIFCATDLNLSGIDIFVYYKSRFQIEFLYRDAKQYTGLEHCQSKDEMKLDFHFNTALTTVSLVKAIYHLSQPIEQRTPFSMADIKTQYFNELMFELIISKCGINPHLPKIIDIRRNVLNFGKIRA